MKKIISLELQKIIPYSIFWIFAAILVTLFLLFSISISHFEINFFGANVDAQNFFKFPHIWNTFTWIASWFNHILALIIIILITNEYNFRTFKQGIIDGLNRNQIVAGKLFVIVSLSISFTFVVFLVSAILGSINSDNFIDFFDKFYFLGIYILQTIAIMSFAMFIAFLLKNTALSIITYIGYIIFETIIRLIFRISGSEIFYYFPMKIISNLTPRPSLSVAINEQQYSDYVQNVEGVYAGIDSTTTIFLAVFFTTIFIVSTFLIIRKRNF